MITDKLLDRYVSFPRFLTITELSNLADNSVRIEYIEKLIIKDNRFIQIRDEADNGIVFISQKSLLNWFSSLNYDLSRVGIHRLSSQKIAQLLNLIRNDGRWIKPPNEIMNFVEKYGLVAQAWCSEQYIFPLSKIMASLTVSAVRILYDFLLSIENWDSFISKDPSKLLLENLKFIDQRTLHIVFEREELLDGYKKTLEAIGKEYRVTRERIRQIEQKFWKRVLHPGRTKIFIEPFLCDFLKRRGSMIINLKNNEALWRVFISKCVKIPTEMLYGSVILLASYPKEIFYFNEPIGLFTKNVSVEALANKIDLRISPCFSHQELLSLCQLVKEELVEEIDKKKKKLTKIKKVFYSLKKIGKPSHYSEVYERYLKLFPEDIITEHSVHTTLSRQIYGVVWIGVRGTFALEEWGYQRPKKTLFETTFEIVKTIYQKNKRPVSLGVITCELGKYRKIVNYASLYFATYFNKKLKCVHKDHFIPKKLARSKSFKSEGQALDKVLRDFMGKIKTD